MRARMWRDASPPELMLEERRPLTAIAEEPLQTLYFAPERDVPGRLYLWEVALEGDEADGIALCADSQARTRSQSMALTWPKCLRMTGSTSTHVSPSCRAYVVYATEQALDDNSTISRLLSSDFDLRNIALIEQAGALPAQTVLPATPAQVLVDDNTRLVLSATAQVPALLVLADQFYPGWRVTVNGAEQPVVRVNHVLRGVWLEPGEQTIEFSFQPASLL